MRTGSLRTAVLSGAVALGLFQAQPVLAADVDIVVDRRDGHIELFIATRADGFVTAFDLPAGLLVQEDGSVDFAPLRQGTWEIGDALMSNVTVELQNGPVAFEAMSLMVHPLANAPPMTNPFEGLMAMSVCTVDTPATPLGLDGLQGYVGYIAYVEDSDGTLSLRLPQTGRGDLEVHVRDFVAGRPAATEVTLVPDGGVVSIGSTAADAPSPWVLGLFGF
ncbi:MAG: hypothetical protein AAF677_01340 [Pseudomonadota bacterium]